MLEFSDANAPCFALGLVEIEGHETGFLAMRPEEAISADVMGTGFEFGHTLYGSSAFVLAQFIFRFYGYGVFQALVNPADPTVCTILEIMIERGDYVFMVLNPDNRVSVFRADIGETNLAGLRDNLPVMQNATTDDLQYERGIREFSRNPVPDGIVMNWVCRDKPVYLDLKDNVATLNPAR